MSSAVNPSVIDGVSSRKCSFCAEPVRVDARKRKHGGVFVNPTLSVSVGLVFALGVVSACVLAGHQPAPSHGVLSIGAWAIFPLLFARVFGRG